MSRNPIHRGGNPSISGLRPPFQPTLDSTESPPMTFTPSRDDMAHEVMGCYLLPSLFSGALFGLLISAIAVFASWSFREQELTAYPFELLGESGGRAFWALFGAALTVGCGVTIGWRFTHARAEVLKRAQRPPSRLDKYR